jgi:hypothetical protein
VDGTVEVASQEILTAAGTAFDGASVYPWEIVKSFDPYDVNGQRRGQEACFNSSRSARRKILPTLVLGSSVRK